MIWKILCWNHMKINVYRPMDIMKMVLWQLSIIKKKMLQKLKRDLLNSSRKGLKNGLLRKKESMSKKNKFLKEPKEISREPWILFTSLESHNSEALLSNGIRKFVRINPQFINTTKWKRMRLWTYISIFDWNTTPLTKLVKG